MAYAGYGSYGYIQPNYYAPNGAIPDALNQYKGQYSPPSQMPMQAQPQPQMQAPPPQQVTPPPNNDIIWVQGEAGAKAYLIAPGCTVTLWDSENPTIYVKSADMAGIPSMRILDWTERPATKHQAANNGVLVPSGEFVRMEDFNELQAKLEALEGKIKNLAASETKTTNKTSKAKEAVENA